MLTTPAPLQANRLVTILTSRFDSRFRFDEHRVPRVWHPEDQIDREYVDARGMVLTCVEVNFSVSFTIASIGRLTAPTVRPLLPFLPGYALAILPLFAYMRLDDDGNDGLAPNAGGPGSVDEFGTGTNRQIFSFLSKIYARGALSARGLGHHFHGCHHSDRLCHPPSYPLPSLFAGREQDMILTPHELREVRQNFETSIKAAYVDAKRIQAANKKASRG